MGWVGRSVLVLFAIGIVIAPGTRFTTRTPASAAPASAACAAPPHTGDMNGTLVVDTLPRTYLLHIPSRVHSGQRYPLVIVLYFSGGNASDMAYSTKMSDIADQHGFLAAYPEGVNQTWHTDAADDKASQGSQNDVRFISRLIDAVSARVCVDPQRVYVTGGSSGGSMAYRLACDLSSRIAAIAPVDGTYTYTRCAPTRSVSVIAFHGAVNADIPYHGGGIYHTPDIPTWARGWAHRDGCTRGPTQFSSGKGFTAMRYTACHGGTEVQLYTMIHEGDQWPDDFDLKKQVNNASKLIWSFFAAHPRR